ncbi:MAG: hypothetical protein KKE23_04255 [Nanoarchaeota archaeon]|nr:hypothetical protein [Nanoarchaeota archaeon]
MEITEEVAELIGALIGDGYIYRKNGKYQIGFVGSPKTDMEYFESLRKLILSEWNKESKLTLRERGLRIIINSKELANFLIDELGIPHGDGKCEKVIIPKLIADDWNLARKSIRGIADTDGSVFVAQKPGTNNYPSIEITTSSKALADQIKNLLSENGFRVANIWSYKSKLSKRTTYKVPLNGKENIRKWIEEIGFSNPYKLNRALEYSK